MSMSTMCFPMLPWSCKLTILSYLHMNEMWVLGCTCRGAFITFLREKDSRIGAYLNPCKFLSSGYFANRPCLVSYPRSGNTYLRKALEETTGFLTGSDSRPNRTLTSYLLRFGFIGEGICDESVIVVKSHFPERLGYVQFETQKIILLVRNPFDAIESYFHMGMTNTHNKSLTAEVCSALQLCTVFVTYSKSPLYKTHSRPRTH
jgi:Sulfotransferase domain